MVMMVVSAVCETAESLSSLALLVTGLMGDDVRTTRNYFHHHCLSHYPIVRVFVRSTYRERSLSTHYGTVLAAAVLIRFPLHYAMQVGNQYVLEKRERHAM